MNFRTVTYGSHPSLVGVLLAAFVVGICPVPEGAAQQTPPPPSPTDAQNDRPASTAADDSSRARLRMMAKATEDGVILRWAPTSARAWHFANEVGYIVERVAVEAARPDAATIDSLRRDAPRDADTADVDAEAIRRLLDDVNDEGKIDSTAMANRLRDAGVDAADVPDVVSTLLSDVEPTILDRFEVITPDTLTVWGLDQWAAVVDEEDPEDRYAAIAAQMLHGESVMPEMAGPYATMRTRADEYENRYGFSLLAADLNAVAARGLALRYTDETAAPESRPYSYRVYPARQPDDFTIDTAYVSVGPEDLGAPPPPQLLSTEVTTSKTVLKWPRSHAGTSYTAYYVERTDGLSEALYTGDTDLQSMRPETFMGGEFTRLTDTPYLPMRDENGLGGNTAFYNDTTATAMQDYTYRVYGVTPFATVSLPAQVRVPGRDLVPPPPPSITDKEQVKGSTVRLEWEIPEAPSDLEGFEIGISNDASGPFVPDTAKGLLPPSARSTTDSRAISNTMNYYVVTAVDTAGNRARSAAHYVQLIDSIPPPPPSGLEAQADTNGIVTVRWNLGETRDLDGYKVFQSNDADDPIVLQTGELHRDTTYVDTVAVQSLTKETFYAVEAVDQNNNVSEKSRIRVELPDVVPPTAPVIRDARPTTESVELAWTASVSDDVARHLVLRRTPAADSGAEDAWTERAALSDTAEAYVDAAVEQGQDYTYLVVAEDSAGLRSEGGHPVRARPYDSGVRPGVEAVEATVPEKEAVQLTWDYPNPAAGEYWFVVYRSEGEGGLRRYHASDGPRFEDDAARTDSTYRYAVQVVYEDGGQSRLSKKVEVEFPRE